MDGATLTAGPGAQRVLRAVTLLGAAVAVYAVRSGDPDLFGYLAYGRLFLQEGRATLADPFAYTSTGRTWVAFEYLAQVVLWVTFERFGPLGLIVLKCVIGGAAVFFLYLAVRAATSNPIVWVPVFLLCTVTLARYFIFRPQLFTFAFFALFTAVVFRFLLDRSAPLWMLPPVTLVWANLHGGFVAGLGTLVMAVIIRLLQQEDHGPSTLSARVSAIRPLAITLAACVLASFVNPHGVRLWGYVVTELAHDTNRRYIREWQPVGLENDPWSGVALTVIAVCLVCGVWLAHRRSLGVAGLRAWQWLALSAPVVLVGYLTVRNVPIAAIWLAPILTLFGAGLLHSNQPAAFSRLWLALSSSALVAVLLAGLYVLEHPRPEIRTDGQVLGSTHPCRVVTFMRLNGLAGRLYNPLWWGSYITWELYPAVQVSMDGRNISLFSRDTVLENLRFYTDNVSIEEAEAPLRYATDFLVVPSDRAVLALVNADTRWQRVYADADAELFARADAAGDLLKAAREGTLMMPTGPCSTVLTSD